MERDVSDLIGQAVGMAAREGIENVSRRMRKRKGNVLSGPAKLAAGAGLVILTPIVSKVAGKAISNATGNAVDKAKDNAIGKATDTAVDKVKENAPAPLKAAAKVGAVPGKVGEALGGGKSGGVEGVGKGRRMPVQQDIDIGAPLSVVYNQWTQFEDWPEFMHRVQQVSQEDETHVSFKTKIWGKSKEFKAEIEEQIPDERIKWRVTDGPTHAGVVTFHELGPRLTRVEVSLDLEPGSLIEKAARGMRHVKRAVRADMARFKAYVLMQGEESGAWRGTVEDGDVKRSSARNGSSSKSGSSKSTRSGSRSTSKPSGSRSTSKPSGSRSTSKPSGSRSASKSSASRSKRTRGATNGGTRGSSGRSNSGSSRSRSASHK